MDLTVASLEVAALQDGHSNQHPAELNWVELALFELLELEPASRISALGGEVPPRVVELPAGLILEASRGSRAETPLLTVIAPSDQAAVVRAWWRARTNGMASAVVHLHADADKTKVVHLFDLRDRHGVVVVVLTDDRPTGFREAADHTTRVFEGPRPVRFGRIAKNASSVILDVDSGAQTLLGWTCEELVGRPTLELIHPDDHPGAISCWMAMLGDNGMSRPARYRYRHRDGRWLWMEVTNDNRLSDPLHGDVLSHMVDVTDEERTARDFQVRQQLLEQVTESLPVGVFHADLDGSIIYSNNKMVEMSGLHPGQLIVDWQASVGSAHRRELVKAISLAAGGQESNAVIEVTGPSSTPTFLSLLARPLRDRAGEITGVTGSLSDVSSEVRRLRQLEVRAATDSLTGCLNRRAILARVQESLDDLSSPRDGGGVGVMFVDVDGMKRINDELGHATGDAVLVEMANRLGESLRGCDGVGRFGGDEFLVVAPGLCSASYALLLANHVSSRLSAAFESEGVPVALRASVGVSWTSRACSDAGELVNRADAAMYQSKREGSGEPVLAY